MRSRGPPTPSRTGNHAYWGADAHFRSHGSVDHGAGEYVRGIVHTNFAGSFFSLLKRGILGTFHHVSRQHILRYLEEFDFRWNRRDATDALRSSEGKRLYYRTPRAAAAFAE